MMSIVRVVIVYGEKVESISVNNIKMEGISSIQKKPIVDWFEPSHGRDGWEGLISEIQKIVMVEPENYYFDFRGSEEDTHIFMECLKERGLGNNENRMTQDEIIQKNMDDAKRAEDYGLDKKAFDLYLKAASDDVNAQYKVAKYYERFYKGELNFYTLDKEEAIWKAIDWYEKAAKQEHRYAQYRLFQIFSRGEGVKKDLDKAMNWLKRAAENECAEAQLELGNLYYDDYSKSDKQIDSDEKIANVIKWYEKAADNGSNEAYGRLGICYMMGFGVTKDKGKAEEYFHIGADSGDRLTQFWLAEYYRGNSEGEENSDKAFEYYKKAALQGFVKAELKLADCYRDGIGTDQDFKEAFEWYREAAKDKDKEAQNNVGCMYRDGIGTDQDVTKALEWFKESEKQGYAPAKWNLGIFYQKGMVVEKDLETAYELFLEAAKQDQPEAQCEVGKCYDYGEGTKQNYGKAMEWYKKAIQNGYNPARFYLGECYNWGTGVAIDREAAFRLFKEGADNEISDPYCCFRMSGIYLEKAKEKMLGNNKKKKLPGPLAGIGKRKSTSKIDQFFESEEFLQSEEGKKYTYYKDMTGLIDIDVLNRKMHIAISRIKSMA